jgi:hypothetical protein
MATVALIAEVATAAVAMAAVTTNHKRRASNQAAAPLPIGTTLPSASDCTNSAH